MSPNLAKMPNGMEFAQINAHETQFLYDEIFVQEVYAAYDLQVPRGGLILDIGANIGMFARYAAMKFPASRIWCFEPAPHCLDRLRVNIAAIQDSVRIFPVALGDRDGETEFSYYPNYSIMSGMFADAAQDFETLRAGARAQYEAKYRRVPSDREMELLVGPKLAAPETFHCPIMRLSRALAEEPGTRVSLAKIDVERAEQLVLAGIDEQDWPRFDQLVIEAHDQGSREHETMAERLRERGYVVRLFVEPMLKDSAIHVLVAKRPAA